MSTSTNRPAHGADPWWGEPEPEVAVGFDSPIPVSTASARPRRRAATRSPWWMRLLRLPFVAFGRAVRRSPSLRKALLRLVILTVVALGIAGSVGVILINNVVIDRTAELGRLDQERRELRRDNAVLDAEAARKSSQTVIVNKAEKQLGMRRAAGAPVYTFLDPESSDIAAKQRLARAAKAKRDAQIAAAAVAASSAAVQSSKENE